MPVYNSFLHICRMRYFWMIIFLLLPLLGQVYTSWQIYKLLPLPPFVKAAIVVLMTLAFALFFVALSPLEDKMPYPASVAVYEVGESWLFILLYLVMLLVLLTVLRHLRPLALWSNNTFASLCLILTIIAIFTAGYFHYLHKSRIEVNVATRKPLQHDLRIVMLSDLHLGYHNRLSELKRWINIINREQPDMVLIAGDIIDMSMRPVDKEQMWRVFKEIKSPIYACPGNHDYYTGISSDIAFCQKAGITMLRDSVVNVDGITIVGRDDRTNPHRKPLSKLISHADSTRFTLLIDHQPYHLEEASNQGIDFQFSGHTHDGQVWPVSWITRAVYEKSYGNYTKGNTRYYISSGIGIWGGKFRIGTRSEYVVFNLKRTSSH